MEHVEREYIYVRYDEDKVTSVAMTYIYEKGFTSVMKTATEKDTLINSGAYICTKLTNPLQEHVINISHQPPASTRETKCSTRYTNNECSLWPYFLVGGKSGVSASEPVTLWCVVLVEFDARGG